MSESRGERMSDREIFDEVLEHPAAERDALLAALTGGDLARRARIAQWLLAERESSGHAGFLDAAFIASVGAAGAQSLAFGPLPRTLGPFRLLGVLGSGGMGVVFEAEQDRPRRRVALKVMRSDLASRDAIHRFRREIETLGRLQHPGIAQIHEAGTIDEGDGAGAALPYIAMELVRGASLDEFVRIRRADARTIVELVASVSDAVHHAHQRGVVHRDLKPANVLVVSDPDQPPRPTVLDFGIARLTGREARGPGTLATSAGQILGTLAYMSPEQLGGDPSLVDGRTDVYALGVILFELLSGRLPLDVRDRPIADAARIVRDEEPTRLGSVDARLRGDLETIVSKAIEKDAARRYPSAQAFGDELRRYLRDEPILARPTTRIERMRRFARRNRAIVIGASATILALLLGTIATAVFASRAVRSRDAAEWLAYRANVAAASAAFAGHDMSSARRFLDSAPARYRGWEWRYLATNLDRSAAIMQLPGDRSQRRGEMLPQTGVLLQLARGAWAGRDWTLPDAWPVRAPRTAPPPAGAIALASLDPTSGRELWIVEHQSVVVREADGSERRLKAHDLPHFATAEAALLDPHTAAIDPEGEAVVLLFRSGDSGTQLAWYGRLDGSGAASVELRNLGRHFAVAMGTGGSVAFGGGPERLPIIWHPREGTVLPIRGHLGDVNAVAISHDGSMVATGGADRSVRLFDAKTGAPIAMVREHLDQVTCLAFTPDDMAIGSGSYDHTVRVWAAPALTSLMVLDGHRGFLQTLECTGDGAWFLSCDDELALRLWPRDSAAAVGEMHVADNACGMLAFAAHAPALLATNGAGVMRMWNLAEDPTRAVLPAAIVASSEPRVLDSGAVAPDGRMAVGLERDSQPSIYRLEGDRWSLAWAGQEPTIAVGFAEDGRCVALLRHDAGDGAAPALARLRSIPDGTPIAPPLPRLVSPTTLTSPDGRVVALRDSDRDGTVVRVLDAADGHERYSFRCAYGGSFSIAQLPSGQLVCASVEATSTRFDDIQTITIRDGWTGEALRELHGHTAHVFALAFTPDGTRLASAGRDRLIRFWDTTTWDEIAALSGPTSFVWALRFSPDGQYLASSGGDRTYRLWRAKSER